MTVIDNLENTEQPKYTGLNITQRLQLVMLSMPALVKTGNSHFGKEKTYTMLDLVSELQPALVEAGVVLQYIIESDTDREKDRLLYYRAKEKEGNDNWGTKNSPDITTTTVIQKEVKDGVFKDVSQAVTKVDHTTTVALAKTILFYRFKGKWINIDNPNDFITIQFPILVELRDSLSADQSLGAATTYAFRTNVKNQFLIPAVELDADMTEFHSGIQSKLKEKRTDNEYSKIYKQIKELAPTHPYILKKENEFQNSIKLIYGDCNDYYEFLLLKVLTHFGGDIRARVDLRSELDSTYKSVISHINKGV